MGNSTPCKIGTPESIILKLCTRDYVGEMTHHANFGFNRCSGGFSPNMPNVTILWLFGRSLPFFLDPAPRSNRWTDFHALWLKRRVSAQGWSFWGLKRWVTIFGEICPNLPPPMGVNRQFQARTAKFKNRNISIITNRIKINLRPGWYRQLHFVGGLTSPTSNSTWLQAAILKKMHMTS